MCSIALVEIQEPTDSEKPLELLEREICTLAAHLAAATCRWLLLPSSMYAGAGRSGA